MWSKTGMKTCLLLAILQLLPSVAMSDSLEGFRLKLEKALSYEYQQDRARELQYLYYAIGVDIYTKSIFRQQTQTIARRYQPQITFKPLGDKTFSYQKNGRSFFLNEKPEGLVVFSKGGIEGSDELPYAKHKGEWVIPALVTERIGMPLTTGNPGQAEHEKKEN